MSTKWFDDRRKGIIEEAVLNANASTIGQSIKKLTKFFTDLDYRQIHVTLRENPAVARSLDYSTNIGGTAMLMYACTECGRTTIRSKDWFNGIKVVIQREDGTTELVHAAWFCALDGCVKKFITKK